MQTMVEGLGVRVTLTDDGLLVLSPRNRAAAINLTGATDTRDIFMTPDQVVAVRDMVPSDDGVLTGWLEISVGGAPFRVPYRRSATPAVRELLRLMEDCGYPERAQIGQREVLPA